ncbi:MAG: helix-turn-helix domain-containing protein, partial [Variovorax sp.]
MGITSATPHKPSGHENPPSPRSDLPQGTGRQRAATAGTDVQRERILQAAAQLFATQGYTNTTMAQIVRALDVTKPFVYYYFRDKQ